MRKINSIEDAKEEIKKLKNPNCAEDDVFYQALEEVLLSIYPLFESDELYNISAKNAIVKRLIMPDRVIKFKVAWLDDDNIVQVNTGYRVQFNNALGPYKGGLRFHPSVNEGILKFLAFEQIIKNGCVSVSEGANMPSTKEAVSIMQNKGILLAPAKAANAGGVAVSGFEMSQNAAMQKWTFEEVDEKLKATMESICENVASTAEEYHVKGNYVDGANIAGFKRVADAMIAEGI